MADAVVRFRIDSQEYDAKIKKASDALGRFFDAARNGGKSVDQLDSEVVDAVKSLGRMDTQATSAKGKINEMSKAYVELSMRYRKMTDEEKASPVGKAMAKSLDELKGRINESKKNLQEVEDELRDVGEESKETGGILDKLAGKFGLTADQLKKFAGIMGIGAASLKVLKDAFFNNEEQLDNWGRTTEMAGSLYNGFLNALNTGDISGYLQNIDNIVTAAKNAYDALDELGTFNAFNQINLYRTKRQMDESIADFREGSGTKEDAKVAADAYKKELGQRAEKERNAYIEKVGQIAAERGVSSADLLNALSGSYGSYKELKKVQPTGRSTESVGGGMYGYSQSIEVSYPTNAAERMGVALRALNDTELENLQALGAQAERTGDEIAQVDKMLVRMLKGGTTGGGKGGGGGKTELIMPENSVADLNKQLSELKKNQTLATNAEDWKAYDEEIKKVSDRIKEINGLSPKGSLTDLNAEITELRKAQSTVTTTGEWEAYDEKIRKVTDQVKALKGELAAIGIGGLANVEGVSIQAEGNTLTRESIISSGIKEINNQKVNVPEQKEEKMSDVMGKMAGGITSIASGVEGLGIEVPKGIKDVMGGIQSVTSILSGISAVVSIIQAISAADAIIPFATGGVVPRAARGYYVPGSHLSGDRTPILANAGELILSRAQVGNLASQMASPAKAEMLPYLDCETIWLGLRTYLNRSGQGEILTSNSGLR